MGILKKLLSDGIALAVFSTVGLCYKVVKVRAKLVYAAFAGKFLEPIEVCYLVMSDDTLYRLTSNDTKSIRFNFSELKEVLAGNGHKISDIIVIIHSHLVNTSRNFSLLDIQTWYNFKMEGFTGNFYLYYQGNRTIYELIEDKHDN